MGPLGTGRETWEGCVFYLDWSGGAHTADKHEDDKEATKVVQASWGALEGKMQTPPRAELKAAIEVLKLHQGSAAEAELVTDCLYVHRGANNEDKKKARKNGDLWSELFERKEEIEQRGGSVRTKKVTACTGLVDIYLGDISWDDYGGNLPADAFAEKAASMVQVFTAFGRRSKRLTTRPGGHRKG